MNVLLLPELESAKGEPAESPLSQDEIDSMIDQLADGAGERLSSRFARDQLKDALERFGGRAGWAAISSTPVGVDEEWVTCLERPTPAGMSGSLYVRMRHTEDGWRYLGVHDRVPDVTALLGPCSQN
jgi:hypothetical protein